MNAGSGWTASWETFTLIDLNGGDLIDGDPIAFRTNSGLFLQADGGGGGTLLAVGQDAWAWETFHIHDLDHGGVVQSGDFVALESDQGFFVCAEGGGGDVVNVNRAAIGGWETLRLIIH